MSDVYYFDICPKCKADFKWATPDGEAEFSGYVGDQVKCPECKTIFRIVIELKEIKKEVKK
jgi:phage FluMu protein Com